MDTLAEAINLLQPTRLLLADECPTMVLVLPRDKDHTYLDPPMKAAPTQSFLCIPPESFEVIVNSFG